MFINIRSFTDAGLDVNEDSYAISDSCLVVMDGASGLYDSKVTDAGSDAQWLARRGAGELIKSLSNHSLSMSAAFLEAAKVLREEFNFMARGQLPMSAVPSAGVAAIRIRDDILEYYGLGDLTTYLRHRDGSIEIVHDNTITELDSRVEQEMVRMAVASGETVKEQRPKVQELLRINRSKRNKSDGYMIFDTSLEGIEHGIFKQWNLNDIISVILISDGMAAAVAECSADVAFDRLYANPADVCAGLRAAQAADPDFNMYPRFKMGDDATLVAADISK